MRVEKRFALGERFMASALVEFFDLFNARKAGLIDNAWVNGAPSHNSVRYVSRYLGVRYRSVSGSSDTAYSHGRKPVNRNQDQTFQPWSGERLGPRSAWPAPVPIA